MVSPSWAETGAANKRATARRANNCFMVKMWIVVVSFCQSRWLARGEFRQSQAPDHHPSFSANLGCDHGSRQGYWGDLALCESPLSKQKTNKTGQKKKTRLTDGSFAERRGFEPRIPFWSIHAFQACALSHSATSPPCPENPGRNGRARYPIFQHSKKQIWFRGQEDRNPISEWSPPGSVLRRALA